MGNKVNTNASQNQHKNARGVTKYCFSCLVIDLGEVGFTKPPSLVSKFVFLVIEIEVNTIILLK
jgi:hypothetical protein